MKKICVLLIVAVAATSCGLLKKSVPSAPAAPAAPAGAEDRVTSMSLSPSSSTLLNSASVLEMPVTPMVDLYADLQVSSEKISYTMVPAKSVKDGGYKNILATAIREALLANGDADVIVGLETTVKCDRSGEVESITVSGYPAKYINFRSVK